MKDWYLRQSPRDRLIVLAVGALVALGLLYALLWHPVSSRIDARRTAIASKTETLEFMRRAEAEIRAAGGAGAGAGGARTSDQPPYLLVDRLIREAGVPPPDRVEPAGEDGARVQFSEVEFDALVPVLAELELYGLEVTNMTLTRRKSGVVSARFNVERG